MNWHNLSGISRGRDSLDDWVLELFKGRKGDAVVSCVLRLNPTPKAWRVVY